MRLSNAPLSALVTCALLMTAGCKPSIEKMVVGKWKGTMNVAAIQNMSPAMKAMINPDISLDVREDKSYSLTMSVPMEGKWEAADGKLTLHPDKFMGMPFQDFKAKATAMAQAAPSLMGEMNNLDQLNQPFVYKVAEDGKSLTLGGTVLAKASS